MSMKYVPPPCLSGKNYEQYRIELDLWESITDVAAEKRCGTVAFSLPEDHESRIRQKVFNEITLADMKKTDGLKILTTFMDKVLKKDDITDRWLKYDDFDECKRGERQSIDEFLVTFDEKYKRILKGGTTIPADILAFMMLKRARITKDERLLVITGMNFEKKDELYEQAKKSLKKFKGDQAYVGGCSNESSVAIKLEPSFLAENETALFAAGYQRAPQTWRGRGRGRGAIHRGGRGGGNRNSDGGGDGDGGQSNGFPNRGGRGKQRGGTVGRNLNPVGNNGTVLTCVACGSFRHLLAACPDSWENLEKANVCQLQEDETVTSESQQYNVGDFKSEMLKKNECDEEEVNCLFTGSIKANIARLGMEAQNSMVVDSACSKTVCGKKWLKCYIDSLDEQMRTKLRFEKGEKMYKFGGGVKLKSCALVTLPAFIGGVEEVIVTDVVESDIPLLWSTKDMKTAQVILNFKNDTAEINGRLVDLQNTSSGHYCVPLLANEVLVSEVFVTGTENMKPKEVQKKLLHLHRQFAHPPMEKLIKLLKDAEFWEDEYTEMLNKIHESCVTCKEYAKVPPRPVVALPMATKFNEKVAMDLKQWEERWILHLIDMFTRFTVSVFVDRKKPSGIIDKIMLHWVGAGYGVMGGILTDNGGEFNAEEMREVSSILNVFVNTTAAQSPFQNGLCERVHSVTDMMLSKLRADNPDVSLDVLLCWACNARNSLQMWQGYSSYQLVFGKNPNLPNIMVDAVPALEGTTSSETLAKHLNALHSSRQAFIKSESDERIRRALRHKIRASEQVFKNGDRVYYKRQGSEKYLGPGRVVFQDGKVIFVRHGGVFVRVSPTHLIRDTNEALGQKAVAETEKVSVPPILSDDSDDEVTSGVSTAGKMNEGVAPANSEKESYQFPKKGQLIQYRKDDAWKSAVVTGRGGKVGSKWEEWCNVKDETGAQEGVNLAVRENWRVVEDTDEVNEVNVVIIPKNEQATEECLKAKEAELEKLREFNAFEEVEDHGQFRISSTWAMTRKGDGVRARLVARGFEEENTMPKDSPTVAKSTLRLFLSICASEKWTLRSTDIRSAFLQGKLLERDVFIKPPKEACSESYLAGREGGEGRACRGGEMPLTHESSLFVFWKIFIDFLNV